MADVQEFVPQHFDTSTHENGSLGPNTTYDPFHVTPPIQANPYQDSSSIAGAAFYQGHNDFQQPVQYHLYAPIGPHNTNVLPHQRNVHQLFIPNDFREELQKKSAATLQTLPNSQLPAHIENYHSLVPLDTNHQKSSTIFGGYSTWVYKAQSSVDGNFVALRRIEGFRLTSELAIRSVQNWKQIINASVVRVQDAFTNRSFGDSSLIFVTDYHPLSKTLAQHHFGQGRGHRTRHNADQISELVLWSYVTQIASALKAIHSNGLAARVVDTTKILLTGKNRVRLNGCAVIDVVQHESQISQAHLQRQDLASFGIVILSLGSNIPDASQNFAKAMDQFKRFYKPDLQNATVWLYSALQNQERTIDQFIGNISSQMITSFNAALHVDDHLNSEFSRELENARLLRLMAKLNIINERPEYEHDRQWSDNGERFYLKLFRDFVFHQVDAHGDPVVDLGHVLACLNKLDAGTEERITLITRDEQSCFIVSYRELKKGIDSIFQELTKNGRRLH